MKQDHVNHDRLTRAELLEARQSGPATCAPRLRVVHLVSTLNIGGLEMMVVNLVRLADRSRIEPHVLCLGEPGELANRVRAFGVPVETLAQSGGRRGSTLRRLVARLHQLRPHVLHTHNPAPHWQGALARLATRVPVLVNTKHGRNYAHRGGARWLARTASWISDAVVPVSEDAADVARHLERVAPRKLHVVLNGIDLEGYTPPERRPETFGYRGICVARLNPVKDFPNLLAAVRRVVDQEPRFRLEVVGDGPARDHVHALCRELQLDAHVDWLGARHDVRERLTAADLFVLASKSEGISLTILEAMMAALPVVATDVGGNREIVVEGRTGRLVPSGDAERLAAAILDTLADPATAIAAGQAGRQRVVERFDIRQKAAQYEELYRTLLARRGVQL